MRSLVHASLAREAIELARQDRRSAWQGTERTPDWVLCELDMQENYMRRMISHAMDYARQFCDLHQAFTSEEVVSYMWSLAPECRTDEIYHELLRGLDPRLCSLPWARTGVALDGTVETNSRLRKDYHDLGRWLRNDLRPRLKTLIFSGGLESLGVFHWPAVQRLWRRFTTGPEEALGSAENVVKLCSIELTRRRFGLRPCRGPTPLRDALSDVATYPIGRLRRVGARAYGQLRRSLRYKMGGPRA